MPHPQNDQMNQTSAGVQGSSAQPRVEGEDTTSHASRRAEDTAQTVKESAGQYAEKGREQARSRLNEQKLRISQELGAVSEAFRAAGQKLHEQERGSVANVFEQGADQADHIAQVLQERDVQEIVSEVESFARERPAVFLGGAVGLGILASRFLKSSGQRAHTSHE